MAQPCQVRLAEFSPREPEGASSCLATQMANLQAENARLNDHLELYRHGVPPSTDTAAKLPPAEQVNVWSGRLSRADHTPNRDNPGRSAQAEYPPRAPLIDQLELRVRRIVWTAGERP
ncbi:hypothetical protein ACGFI9_05310 [Micromonospora sp. NPDC048930]|uniref:hypothetical protein n=1 Tax=Micromonospora sp. NPDC048930 TaxID=3364261 RepID=UPI0037154D8E